MIRIFLFVFLSSPFAKALPIANPQLFSHGNYWVWNYYENGDHNRLYSSEKYTVANVAGPFVTVEIWTKYAGKMAYTPSAKFVANLDDCRQAFVGGRHRPFTIEMYSFSGGRWSTDSYPMKSTAFEEKFNCNPVEYRAGDLNFETKYETESTPWGTERLFQQKAKAPDQILSFYFADAPALAGVAYRKEFNPTSPYEFEMELTDWWQAGHDVHVLRDATTSGGSCSATPARDFDPTIHCKPPSLSH